MKPGLLGVDFGGSTAGKEMVLSLPLIFREGVVGIAWIGSSGIIGFKGFKDAFDVYHL